MGSQDAGEDPRQQEQQEDGSSDCAERFGANQSNEEIDRRPSRTAGQLIGAERDRHECRTFGSRNP